jgi:hypothetical protein
MADFDAVESKADKVVEYCMSNPKVTLMHAIETTLGAAK